MSSEQRRATTVRRIEIIQAVTSLLAAQGIQGTSMRQIAAATGLSTGTINYHFKNKRGLIIAAMDAAYGLPSDWDEYRAQSAVARLKRMAQIFILRSEGARRWWKFWLDYVSYSNRDPELLRHHRRRYERQHRFFARIISQGIENGELRGDMSPEDTAHELLALANGLAAHQLVAEGNVKPEDAQRILHSFIDRLRTD